LAHNPAEVIEEKMVPAPGLISYVNKHARIKTPTDGAGIANALLSDDILMSYLRFVSVKCYDLNAILVLGPD
jgi:hypothetical protein